MLEASSKQLSTKGLRSKRLYKKASPSTPLGKCSQFSQRNGRSRTCRHTPRRCRRKQVLSNRTRNSQQKYRSFRFPGWRIICDPNRRIKFGKLGIIGTPSPIFYNGLKKQLGLKILQCDYQSKSQALAQKNVTGSTTFRLSKTLHSQSKPSIWMSCAVSTAI